MALTFVSTCGAWMGRAPLTILEINLLPALRRLLGRRVLLGIGAVNIAGERVVEPVLFDYYLERGVLRPGSVLVGCQLTCTSFIAYQSSPKKPAMKFSADFNMRSCVWKQVSSHRSTSESQSALPYSSAGDDLRVRVVKL